MVFLKEYLDLMIFGTLMIMSFISLWFAIERFFFYKNVSLNEFEYIEQVNVTLTDHLTVIYSVGANAPYVGLLGTVMGILITFHDLGQGGDISPATIMMGLALALKATAAGLFVAIPAIVIYNSLLRKVEVLTAEWTSNQSRLLKQ